MTGSYERKDTQEDERHGRACGERRQRGTRMKVVASRQKDRTRRETDEDKRRRQRSAECGTRNEAKRQNEIARAKQNRLPLDGIVDGSMKITPTIHEDQAGNNPLPDKEFGERFDRTSLTAGEHVVQGKSDEADEQQLGREPAGKVDGHAHGADHEKQIM